MILNGTHNPVETSGDVTSRSFKILASRKAFEILSSGLYSHKIRAIVRELGTNAADAHVAAGNPAPFHVTLPGRYHAFFEVKDFGTGLSEADVLNLYTTYFDSNKTTSNDLTGCLGLGSKSPFSYTDSFTVESRYEGTKTTYTAYLDTNGIPAVSKVHAEATDEPNGLTVRIPVEADDFNEFRGECQRVYAWFTPKPEIHGEFHGYVEYSTLFEGDDYIIGRKPVKARYADYEPGVLVMGNVAYPIDFGKTDGALARWRKYGIVLHAPIGSVEIAASREALSYDARTLAYLEERGRRLTEDLPRHATAFIADAGTLWEARQRLHKLKQLFSDLGDLTATWGGRPIESTVEVLQITKLGNRVAGELHHHPGYEADVVEYSWKSGKWSSKRSSRPRNPNQSPPLSRLAPDRNVWLADTPTWKADLTAVVQERTAVYVIVSVDPASDFLTRTGIGEVAKRTSDIPKEERERVAKPKGVKVKRVPVYRFTPRVGDAGLTEAAKDWTRCVSPPPRNAVYVEIDAFRVVGAVRNVVLERTLRYLGTLKKAVTVYGVRRSDRDKIGKGWVTLESYVERVATAAYKEVSGYVADRAYCDHNLKGAIGYFADPKHTGLVKGLPKRHRLRRAVEAVLAGGKKDKRIEAVQTAAANLLSERPEAPSKVQAVVTELYTAYPLLELINISGYDKEHNDYAQRVLTYIYTVDASNR